MSLNSSINSLRQVWFFLELYNPMKNEMKYSLKQYFLFFLINSITVFWKSSIDFVVKEVSINCIINKSSFGSFDLSSAFTFCKALSLSFSFLYKINPWYILYSSSSFISFNKSSASFNLFALIKKLILFFVIIFCSSMLKLISLFFKNPSSFLITSLFVSLSFLKFKKFT